MNGIQEVSGSIPLISTILGNREKLVLIFKTSFFFFPMQVSISDATLVSLIQGVLIFQSAPFSCPKGCTSMEEMTVFDYYYGGESEQFAFYRIPRQLVTGSYFKNLSTDAKLLYGLLLDRMSLSMKNGWYDEQGRVYIYYPLEEIQEALCCSHGKAVRLFAELDTGKGIGLIERIRQGQGKPARIYVKQFTTRAVPPTPVQSEPPGSPETEHQEVSKPEVLTSQNETSRSSKTGSQEVPKWNGSYIDINNTYKSQLNQSIYQSGPPPENGGRWMDRQTCRERIRSNIDYDWLATQRKDYEMEEIDELVALIADTVCSTKSAVKIGGDEIPIEEVRQRFLSLDSSNIEYVLDRLHETTTKIHNIHAYLLAALYRSPTTTNHFYRAEVQHDLYGT